MYQAPSLLTHSFSGPFGTSNPRQSFHIKIMTADLRKHVAASGQSLLEFC
jgi:hypothetical protein